MTKIEEKLIELGYIFEGYNIKNKTTKYLYQIENCYIHIMVNKNNKINGYVTIQGNVLYGFLQLNGVCHALGKMQQDLEKLKKYER